MAKIVVIGDIMLDRYYYCKNRNNPESSAPAYISSKKNIIHKPGGAGNVAANLASLKADFNLVSLVGKDADSEILTDSLKTLNIPYKFIYDKKRTTIVKTRALDILDGRYHFRFDVEEKLEDILFYNLENPGRIIYEPLIDLSNLNNKDLKGDKLDFLIKYNIFL